ncbi:UDP-xylose and UDP-N-acetylglucosamine transporter [Patagioenas fasciata monilis]|uniref:Solute carrier family 35 member B4 n=1 Tax=Patagioenas fasciata monilis TaxID=372326 RepID=A0A1V4JWE6_PATFA|nr:UDP-xylose and UDP-N-acetylglucosamine transporter [Patagioenas fasciata monilis]
MVESRRTKPSKNVRLDISKEDVLLKIHRYSVYKYTSIALVSLGIFTCTFMSAKQVASDSGLNEEDGLQVFLWWLLGIAALTFALLMSARMGIFQETLYKQFGKHSKEALFYNHALPLPGFLLLAPNIYHHAVLFSQSGHSPTYTGTKLNGGINLPSTNLRSPNPLA